MKIITHAKNFSLNKEQEDFINEKIIKIRDLSKSLNDEAHEIHIDFEINESKKPEDKYSCIVNANLKGHASFRIEKSSSSVEKVFAEIKNVLIDDIKKIKSKKS
jgi:hypothetical protein